MLPPWLRRTSALTSAAFMCAAVAVAPSSAVEVDPVAEAAARSQEMTEGLAPLLEAVEAARNKRIAADRKYDESVAALKRAQAQVVGQQGEVGVARDVVGSYARAAYRSGPSELAFLAGLLDAESPTDLMRRADTAERVGTRKDSEYDSARQVLARAQEVAAQAVTARDRASEAAQQAAAAEADALAKVSDYTSKWADSLAAGGGGGTDQDAANSAAASAWAAWLNRPEAKGAPTITAEMVRTGKDLPEGVRVKKKKLPGVALWTPPTETTADKKAPKTVVLLPDRTVQMTTYAISRMGAAYKWRTNTHDAMDCSALVDRGWAIPAAGAAAAAADRSEVPSGVPGLAGRMKLVDTDTVLPGDVIFYVDGDHGVNHAGIAVSADTMIASEPLTGGVNAVRINPDRLWQVGRPAMGFKNDKATAKRLSRGAVPMAIGQAWQCGVDPEELAFLSPGGRWFFPTDDEDWRTERINPGTEPGMRMHPVLGYARCHDGWDTGDGMGDPIVAVADGIAVLSPNNGGAGNMITISHGDGVESVYMHLSEFAPGINGTLVRRGQLIGKVGTTGLSSGPHLHFQVNVNGQAVDPRHFFYNDPIKPACS